MATVTGRPATLLPAIALAGWLMVGAPLALVIGPAAAQPAVTALPQGGQVVAGQATIHTTGNTLSVQQSSERAAIDWRRFDVGRDAQVEFIQPSAASVSLNRVSNGNVSQIFGRITANGQVYLSNPAGIYFGAGASVDVGGLVATTHHISLDDFMAGKDRFERRGAWGAVINLGELRSAAGGYIALLAPEVRNQGVIIARMGTVALAAGSAFELSFDAQHGLADVRVEAAALRALVDNRSAVLAPGGLIILSAQAVDRVQGGVIRNSGQVQAAGLLRQGGRLILEASDTFGNTGAVRADASAIGPAGSVVIEARAVLNEGSLSAVGSDADGAGGAITVRAGSFAQGAGGVIDASGPQQGGLISVAAAGTADIGGRIAAVATRLPVIVEVPDAGAIKGGGTRGDDAPTSPTTGIRPTIPTTLTPLIVPPGTVNVAPKATELPAAPVSVQTTGGEVRIEAASVHLRDARVDASGARGGRIAIEARADPGELPAPSSSDRPGADALGHIAISAGSELSVAGRQGEGGRIALTAIRVDREVGSQLTVAGTSRAGQLQIEEAAAASPGVSMPVSRTEPASVSRDLPVSSAISPRFSK